MIGIGSLILRQNAQGSNIHRRRTGRPAAAEQLVQRVESPCGREGPRAAAGGRGAKRVTTVERDAGSEQGRRRQRGRRKTDRYGAAGT